MSINISNVVAQKFLSEVKHSYQAESQLRNTVRVKDAKDAEVVNFNVMGKGQADLRSSLHTPIPLADISHTRPTVTVKNYTFSEMTDIFLNNQIPFDERQELVQTVAKGLGRQLDQLVIDALVAASPTSSVAKNISGANDNLTLAAIRETAKSLDQLNVPSGQRTFLCHASGLHHLLEDSNVTSADFNTIKALVRGDLDSYYGFKFIKLGNRDEGGLPLATNDRTNFAYDKQAVGLAINMDMRTTIDWEPSYGAHRVTGYLSANALVIDADGVVEITTDES